MIFKRPVGSADAISAGMNKIRTERHREALKREGRTYHQNGDVTDFVEIKVVDSSATEAQGADGNTFNSAIHGLAITHSPTPTALPFESPITEVANALMAKYPVPIRRG